MKVWVSSDGGYKRKRFHETPDCIRAQSTLQWEEVELAALDRPEACRVCYPDAPQVPNLWKPWCPLCNKKIIYPCKHNGGVLVHIPRTDKSNRGFITKYVWPESARHYELAS